MAHLPVSYAQSHAIVPQLQCLQNMYALSLTILSDLGEEPSVPQSAPVDMASSDLSADSV